MKRRYTKCLLLLPLPILHFVNCDTVWQAMKWRHGGCGFVKHTSARNNEVWQNNFGSASSCKPFKWRLSICVLARVSDCAKQLNGSGFCSVWRLLGTQSTSDGGHDLFTAGEESGKNFAHWKVQERCSHLMRHSANYFGLLLSVTLLHLSANLPRRRHISDIKTDHRSVTVPYIQMDTRKTEMVQWCQAHSETTMGFVALAPASAQLSYISATAAESISSPICTVYPRRIDRSHDYCKAGWKLPTTAKLSDSSLQCADQ